MWSMDVKADIPRQENGSGYGVFMCAFAEHCFFRHAVWFTQTDMPYFRRRILIEIFDGPGLSPSSAPGLQGYGGAKSEHQHFLYGYARFSILLGI